MKLLRTLIKFATVIGLFAAGAGSARADLVTYALNNGSLDGLTNFGSVLLEQTVLASSNIDNIGQVHVTVSLASPTVFAKTGAGEALTWNLSGVSGVTISDLTAGFGIKNVDSNGNPVAGSYKASPFGNYDYAVSCMTGCGNGTSAPQNKGPLSFTIAAVGLSLDSFVPNTKGGVDTYFAADVGVNGKTGVVGSGVGVVTAGCTTNCGGGVTTGGGSNIADVPEPASLLLLGSGLAALAGFRRLRARRAA